MKALVLRNPGPDFTLAVEDLPTPSPGPGELRLRVRASSINPVDYKFALGRDALPLPHVLGADVAGEVDALGPGVDSFEIGEPAIAITNLYRWGGFAEHVVLDANAVARIPRDLPFHKAATIPCAGLTAWQCLYRKVNLAPGRTILVTAGGGGVGGFLLQLARLLDLRVIATGSRNLDRLSRLGADHVINYQTEDVVSRTLEITEGRGVDVVFDLVSADSAGALVGLLRHNGSMVSVVAGPPAQTLPPWGKAISLHDVALGFAYQFGDAENLRDIAEGGEFLAGLMAEGRLDPMISDVISLTEVPRALNTARTRHAQGKIVIALDG